MEKAREMLELKKEETESVSGLNVAVHRSGQEHSFYEDFSLKGIRIDRVEPGLIACTFKVTSRLTNVTGNFSSGAIANLIDELGGALCHVEGLPMKVSVDMSITYLTHAKVNDELEVISRLLGQKGGYSGTSVLLRNKATGEIIAEGRHSLFVFGGKSPSPLTAVALQLGNIAEGQKKWRVREMLELTEEEKESVLGLEVRAHQIGQDPSFYEHFSRQGIRVDQIEQGLIVCTFKVPPRLTNAAGNFTSGAIANLIDELGWSLCHVEGLPLVVSVDMSISYLASAKANDELEVTSRLLGQKGGYSGTCIQLRNKATGEIVAEGRHSLFGKRPSKM